MKLTYYLLISILLLSGCASFSYRQRYLDSHPNITAEMKHNITHRNVSIGMTKEQVIASIGSPWRINKSYHYGVQSEQWVYEAYLDDRTWYFYFEDGILVSYQFYGI